MLMMLKRQNSRILGDFRSTDSTTLRKYFQRWRLASFVAGRFYMRIGRIFRATSGRARLD
jgi:hypothetical protein